MADSICAKCGQPEGAPCGHDHFKVYRMHGEPDDLAMCGTAGHRFQSTRERARELVQTPEVQAAIQRARAEFAAGRYWPAAVDDLKEDD